MLENKKSELFSYGEFGFVLVETRRIELLSENRSAQPSTGVDCHLNSRLLPSAVRLKDPVAS